MYVKGFFLLAVQMKDSVSVNKADPEHRCHRHISQAGVLYVIVVVGKCAKKPKWTLCFSQ